uniref:HDC10915 n=1 Tax=Drosophila melanogaster TaxID=7227 RepID=Q6IL03_DROME|nr:TPA_inf: HDC10915 [Drosophila melanogaster]
MAGNIVKWWKHKILGGYKQFSAPTPTKTEKLPNSISKIHPHPHPHPTSSAARPTMPNISAAATQKRFRDQPTIDRRTDGRTDFQTNGRTDGRAEERRSSDPASVLCLYL